MPQQKQISQPFHTTFSIQWDPEVMPAPRTTPNLKTELHRLHLKQIAIINELLHLVPMSRMRGAIPPLTQHAFMAWCPVEAQGHLYLYFYA
jgi:hypothetical protein